MIIRKATLEDIPAVEQIYSDIHTAEEKGHVTIGWKRSIYPTRGTALQALKRDDLYVQIDDGQTVGTAIINQTQVDVYRDGKWQYPAKDEEVMVLHTLIISPSAARKGYGRKFVDFYENYAKSCNCKYLRMDTNEKNTVARILYKKLGYSEIGIVPCVFNGLDGVNLVLLEKYIG